MAANDPRDITLSPEELRRIPGSIRRKVEAALRRAEEAERSLARASAAHAGSPWGILMHEGREERFVGLHPAQRIRLLRDDPNRSRRYLDVSPIQRYEHYGALEGLLVSGTSQLLVQPHVSNQILVLLAPEDHGRETERRRSP